MSYCHIQSLVVLNCFLIKHNHNSQIDHQIERCLNTRIRNQEIEATKKGGIAAVIPQLLPINHHPELSNDQTRNLVQMYNNPHPSHSHKLDQIRHRYSLLR
jgi:hypothetical protein